MSVFAALREGVLRSSAQETCFSCAHFCDDPKRIEAEVPGLATLSSAHASVRAQDGLCLAHSLVINGRRRCGSYQERTEAAS